MTSKTTLNAENLESLGAQRLAELLLEIAAGDAAAKRRLRLEIAATAAPEAVAAELRKRLAGIARARAFVERPKARGLAADLDAQRRAIVERVAAVDAAEALELMWRFMALADFVHGRSDDSDGAIGSVFRAACRDLGTLAAATTPDPVALADQAFDALGTNGYGQYDELVAALTPALGRQGLDHLKARFAALSRTPVETPPPDQRKVIGWGSGGPIYQDQIEATSRRLSVRSALQAIADAQGDVDAFIAQHDEEARKVPMVAAEIARRLLAAGRAAEALQTIEAAGGGRSPWPEWEWEDARIATLDTLGRRDEAQAARWSCFERALSARHLRAYLKLLPAFVDMEAEERALDHAERYKDPLQALSFLVSWPALDRAARLVVARAAALDGNHYEILSRAAAALAGKHPLAATLVLRAMIGFTLENARASRYRHAARHLLECASLAGSVPDFGAFADHATYVAGLKTAHARKIAFWSLVT